MKGPRQNTELFDAILRSFVGVSPKTMEEADVILTEEGLEPVEVGERMKQLAVQSLEQARTPKEAAS